jgi:hypothetical protein
MTDNTQELEELYDNWFYSLAGEEPDGTYTLTVHEVHDGGAYSKLEELITAYTNKQIEEILDRLETQALELPLSNGREMYLVDVSAIEAERNKLKEES